LEAKTRRWRSHPHSEAVNGYRLLRHYAQSVSDPTSDLIASIRAATPPPDHTPTPLLCRPPLRMAAPRHCAVTMQLRFELLGPTRAAPIPRCIRPDQKSLQAEATTCRALSVHGSGFFSVTVKAPFPVTQNLSRPVSRQPHPSIFDPCPKRWLEQTRSLLANGLCSGPEHRSSAAPR
jgi:hypothetical protein